MDAATRGQGQELRTEADGQRRHIERQRVGDERQLGAPSCESLVRRSRHRFAHHDEAVGSGGVSRYLVTGEGAAHIERDPRPTQGVARHPRRLRGRMLDHEARRHGGLST